MHRVLGARLERATQWGERDGTENTWWTDSLLEPSPCRKHAGSRRSSNQTTMRRVELYAPEHAGVESAARAPRLSLATRRAFLAALLLAPLCARAQSSARPARIALLSDANESTNAHLWAMFRARLRELGYAESTDYRIEARWANGDVERLGALAAELVAAAPRVIVADGTPSALAAKRSTASIPIVCLRISDPVKTGLVASLARPGGNVTGNTIVTTDIAGKWLELLRELAPQARSLAFLNDTSNAGAMLTFQELQTSAKRIGVQVMALDGRDRTSVANAFDRISRERVEGLIVGTNAIVFRQRDQIVAAAARNRIPAIYARSEYVDAGGLISYGTDLGALYAHGAQYVHRILNGAKPSELPIEQPMRFELAVNMKLAKAIGIAIPPTVMVRATRVIE